MEKIKILLLAVGEEPKVVEIDNTLEAKQEIVGGYIQMVCPPIHDDSAVMICNEEGKLLGLEPNTYLFTEEGIPYDIICGDCFIVDAPFDSAEFGSLSDEQIAKYSMFYG